MIVAANRSIPARAVGWLRRQLFAGVLALGPLVITIWVGRRVLAWLDNIIGKYIIARFPVAAEIPGLGIVALLSLLLVTGTLLRSYVGRRLFGAYDDLFTRIPYARTIYVTVKHLVESFGPDSGSFREVALIEYPRNGIYAMVFVTRDAGEVIAQATGQELVSVFLPTTPNPTSGYLLMVPREQITPISMSVEEATKFIVSAGIVSSGQVSPDRSGLSPRVGAPRESSETT